MYWLEVSVATDGEGAEAVADLLRPYAYNGGVVMEQLGDDSNSDPDALENRVTVKVYLPEKEDTPIIRQRLEEMLYHLNRLYPIPPPTFRKLEEEDWAHAWKEYYHPFRVGKNIWIQPSWREVSHNHSDQDGALEDDLILTLDPGMAFGTGLHPTTQMCLKALEDKVQTGMVVLDVGAGSGILAIAAAKLGARRVLGVDTDEIAVKVAAENVSENNVSNCVSFQQGSLEQVAAGGWDIVVVNILAPVIVLMLERDGLMKYINVNGRLILSGIIEEQAEAVVTAVHAAGGQIEKSDRIGDWVAYTVISEKKKKTSQ